MQLENRFIGRETSALCLAGSRCVGDVIESLKFSYLLINLLLLFTDFTELLGRHRGYSSTLSDSPVQFEPSSLDCLSRIVQNLAPQYANRPSTVASSTTDNSSLSMTNSNGDASQQTGEHVQQLTSNSLNISIHGDLSAAAVSGQRHDNYHNDQMHTLPSNVAPAPTHSANLSIGHHAKYGFNQ